jgi:hypothetical protein
MRLSTRYRLAAALALLALSPLASAATHLEIEGGRSYMHSDATNVAFIEASFDEHQIGNSRFSWAPDASLGWINGRDLAKYKGYKYGTSDTVWMAAGGARFRFGDSSDWYHGLFFSEQIAVLKGRTLALSSAGEFVSTLGWQSGPVSFQIRHISNGGIHDPNRGETMALVGLGFNF